MRTRSAHKNASSKSSHKGYYQQILQSIDTIELLLLHRLVTNDPPLPPKRSQTPNARSSYKHDATPKNKNTARPKSACRFSEPGQLGSTQKMRSIIKHSEASTLLNTPKKQPKEVFNSPFNDKFNSPFDDYIENKLEVIRKTPVGSSKEQYSSRIMGQPSLWSKWNELAHKKEILKKRNKENEESTEGTGVKNTIDKSALEGEVNKLQIEFEGCLMRKKGASSQEEQRVLRSKMTQLSYRIAKIRDRQSKLSMYA